MCTRRYVRIKRKKSFHFGVYDRKSNQVLHVTHKNGKLEYNCCSKYIFDIKKEGTSLSADNIKSSDEEIEERWNQVLSKEWKVVDAKGRDITYIYDVSGAYGLNCESLVEYLLNGEFREPKGDLLKPFVKRGILKQNGKFLGIIDLGSSNSRS